MWDNVTAPKDSLSIASALSREFIPYDVSDNGVHAGEIIIVSYTNFFPWFYFFIYPS